MINKINTSPILNYEITTTETFPNTIDEFEEKTQIIIDKFIDSKSSEFYLKSEIERRINNILNQMLINDKLDNALYAKIEIEKITNPFDIVRNGKWKFSISFSDDKPILISEKILQKMRKELNE